MSAIDGPEPSWVALLREFAHAFNQDFPAGMAADDLMALPETPIRIELTDGAITVSPSAAPLHQFLAAALTMRLQNDALHLVVTQSVDIKLAAKTTRIPDVLVAKPGSERKEHGYLAEDVLLAVEIVSPGSRIDDRVTKPAVYAEAGIPCYVRIELEPTLRAVVYRLEGEAYAEVSDGPQIVLGAPFGSVIDVEDLLPPWSREKPSR